MGGGPVTAMWCDGFDADLAAVVPGAADGDHGWLCEDCGDSEPS